MDTPEPRPRSHPIDRVQERLIEFAFKDEMATAGRVVELFLGREKVLADWEQPCLVGYVIYGHEDERGRRAIDRFKEKHGARLPRDQRAVVESLERAWPSFFGVVKVERDVGMTLRDLVSGAEVSISEQQATYQIRQGDLLLAWIMEYEGVVMFTGALCGVPRRHREDVDRVLKAAIDAGKLADPEAPLTTLTRRALPEVHTALRKAVREWRPPEAQ